tara:strand:+ start:91 stop:384 length:294 start_codon:yes stop_codon:yes gene_type:complete
MPDPVKRVKKILGVTRTVEKGYDPVNEVYDKNYKKVTTSRGDKLKVKEKTKDSKGRKRKLKTTYKGYSGMFSSIPDVVKKKTFTAKGGGKKKTKEQL